MGLEDDTNKMPVFCFPIVNLMTVFINSGFDSINALT